MAKAFGIVNFAGNHIAVEGMQEYRPVGAFSFLGRYRVIDFTISNMSNSGIDHIQVYIRRKPQSLTAHLGTGRHYNINSKSGNLQILYSGLGMNMSLYNNDIASKHLYGYLYHEERFVHRTDPQIKNDFFCIHITGYRKCFLRRP